MDIDLVSYIMVGAGKPSAEQIYNVELYSSTSLSPAMFIPDGGEFATEKNEKERG